jgi:hypothetical protein
MTDFTVLIPYLRPRGDMSPDLYFYAFLRPFLRDLFHLASLENNGLTDNLLTDIATAIIRTAVYILPPWDPVAVALQTAAQQSTSRGEFTIQLSLKKDNDIIVAKETKTLTNLYAALISILLPQEIDAGRAEHVTILSAPLHDILNNVAANYAHPAPSIIDEIYAGQTRPITNAKDIRSQLADVACFDIAQGILFGAQPTNHAKIANMIQSVSFGPLQSIFAAALLHWTIQHPTLGGVGLRERTPESLRECILHAWTSTTHAQREESSAAHANALVIGLTADGQANARAILNRFANINPLVAGHPPTARHPARAPAPTVPPIRATPQRQGQTAKANFWCAFHYRNRTHDSASCTEIAKMSANNQRLFLSRKEDA